MPNATATATPEQLRAARELLALFTDPNHPHRRGTAADVEQARLALAAEIEAQDADGLHDTIHEASYHLGLFCRECGDELDGDLLRGGYCSRECYGLDRYDTAEELGDA